MATSATPAAKPVTASAPAFTANDAEKLISAKASNSNRNTLWSRLVTIKTGFIGGALYYLFSKAGYNMFGCNTLYGRAYAKDAMSLEIQAQMQKVVKAAVNGQLFLKRTSNIYSVGNNNAGTDAAITNLKEAVNVLTQKTHELARAHGKTSGSDIKAFADALAAQFEKAHPSPTANYCQSIAKHTIINRMLRTANTDFANQSLDKITKDFASFLGSVKSAFSGIFTGNESVVKLLKKLAPRLTQIQAFHAQHTGDKGAAKVDALVAERAQDSQSKLDESMARVNALRGDNGFNGEIHKARLDYLKAVKALIEKVDAETKALDRTGGLSVEQLAQLQSFDNEENFANPNAEDVLVGLLRLTGEYKATVYAPTLARSDEVMQKAEAQQAAHKAYMALVAEYATLGGPNFDASFVEADGVKTYNVTPDSIIGKLQAEIADIRPAVTAEVKAVADFWEGIIPKLVEINNNQVELQEVKGVRGIRGAPDQTAHQELLKRIAEGL